MRRICFELARPQASNATMSPVDRRGWARGANFFPSAAGARRCLTLPGARRMRRAMMAAIDSGPAETLGTRGYARYRADITEIWDNE